MSSPFSIKAMLGIMRVNRKPRAFNRQQKMSMKFVKDLNSLQGGSIVITALGLRRQGGLASQPGQSNGWSPGPSEWLVSRNKVKGSWGSPLEQRPRLTFGLPIWTHIKKEFMCYAKNKPWNVVHLGYLGLSLSSHQTTHQNQPSKQTKPNLERNMHTLNTYFIRVTS